MYLSCIGVFLAEICFVCLKRASHRDVSFEAHRTHVLTESLGVFELYCCFPSEMCFVCSKGASHGKVSFEHTEHTFR